MDVDLPAQPALRRPDGLGEIVLVRGADDQHVDVAQWTTLTASFVTTRYGITGETKEKERTGVLRRQTRRVGQFEFMVTTPGDIDPDKVGASLHDGVLTVRVGKVAASQRRQIEVKET